MNRGDMEPFLLKNLFSLRPMPKTREGGRLYHYNIVPSCFPWNTLGATHFAVPKGLAPRDAAHHSLWNKVSAGPSPPLTLHWGFPILPPPLSAWRLCVFCHPFSKCRSYVHSVLPPSRPRWGRMYHHPLSLFFLSSLSLSTCWFLPTPRLPLTLALWDSFSHMFQRHPSPAPTTHPSAPHAPVLSISMLHLCPRRTWPRPVPGKAGMMSHNSPSLG